MNKERKLNRAYYLKNENGYQVFIDEIGNSHLITFPMKNNNVSPGAIGWLWYITTSSSGLSTFREDKEVDLKFEDFTKVYKEKWNEELTINNEFTYVRKNY